MERAERLRIRSLEIAGFKSFPDRVELTFPPGICAIVGPNGCGKSNVVDAIRWVMGEQNARNLRGRTVEDLIFVGMIQQFGGGRPNVRSLSHRLTYQAILESADRN